jgi:hypothetical protein
MDLTHWLETLRPIFAGKRVIVVAQTAASATEKVRQVLACGATQVIVVSTSGAGLGDSPESLGSKVIELNTPDDGSRMGPIRGSQQCIANIPLWAADELDSFDPENTAVVLGDFLNENATLAGRPFLFYRRPEWLAVDDKTQIDKFWDRAGTIRAPSMIVEATTTAVEEVFGQFDQGCGVVIAIDSADGWTGGGAGVRWIQKIVHVEGALTDLLGPNVSEPDSREGNRQVRVMPFLEGIPCSIHGIVFADDVIALRPMEMVVLRQTDGGFFYAGCASYFDPPEQHRESMRTLAKVVGTKLREEVGFRGAFTVDGVLTADGFRPTELNPRNGAGLMAMARAFDQPALLIIDCISSGLELDWRPAGLEHELLSAFDERRAGGTWRSFHNIEAEVPASAMLAINESQVELTDDHAAANLTFTSSVSNQTLLIRATYSRTRTPVGLPTAPLAAAFWNWADTTYHLRIGPLTPAIDTVSYEL